ncbi:MAG TPA: T9SS type A sorting domain-containing protein [Bacteroidia bacterium]|nr:T9SS type A sorting domain-containing protein [Bacteroidia bacterium]HNT80142.1 T9SS type A sorting domain-containing protein [Bacteroidia bacterium]
MKKISTLIVLIALFAFSNSNAQLTVPCGQQSTYWSDDFEGAIPNWSSTNGVWQIGVPNSGPNSAHGGTQCAATNLSGNYPTNITSILKTNSYITIPPAVQNPRLRFWLWCSFATTNGTDYGKVQAKTLTASTWTNLSTFTYTANSSGVWSCEEVDLSAFADSSIQIGFLLFSGNDGYQSSGFYIDDVEIRTGPYISFNPEDFENGWKDWSAEGSWEIGVPTVGPTSGCTGAKCAGTNLNGNYGKESNGHLKSPWMKLPPANQNPSISFCHWFSFATTNGNDFGKLQFRTSTSGWKDTATYSSSSPLWSNVFFDMSSYGDSVIQFGFFLQSLNDNYQSSGWYIDNVYINGLADTSCFYPNGMVATNGVMLSLNNLNVSPNPASNFIIFKFNTAIKKGKLLLINTLGETVLEENLFNESKKEINLKNISQGIYFAKVFDGEKYYCKKLIVEHH